MSEWQPIETAPKDGTKVDLWRERSKPKIVKEHERVANCWWDQTKFVADLGMEYRLLVEHDFWKATHWMPLPEPPRDSK